MVLSSANIIAITGIIQAVVVSLVFILGLLALFRGGWKAIKEFFIASKKMNLFIDKMMPDILSHLSKTERVPNDTLVKWTTIISNSVNFKSSSPLNITDDGRELIKKVRLDIIFEYNKNEWIKKIDEKIENKPASKYFVENKCINFISDIFSDGGVFNPIQNYLFENIHKGVEYLLKN